MVFVLRQSQSSFAFGLFGGLLAFSVILISSESPFPPQAPGTPLNLAAAHPAPSFVPLNQGHLQIGQPEAYACVYSEVTGRSWIANLFEPCHGYGWALSFSPPSRPNPCPAFIPALILLLARPLPSRCPARNTTTILPDSLRSQEGRYHYALLTETTSKGNTYAYGEDQTAGRVAIWPSRDPIGERGGINLYGMVGNDAVGRWDYLGLDNQGPLTGRTLNRFQSLPPEERKKKLAEMRARECCDGVPYEPHLYCCIDDKLYDYSKQGTGVFRALANAWDHAGTHDGLVYENGRTTIGIGVEYWPVDLNPSWWVNDGSFPKDDNGKPKFTAEIKLSKCDYDHEKFRQGGFKLLRNIRNSLIFSK